MKIKTTALLGRIKEHDGTTVDLYTCCTCGIICMIFHHYWEFCCDWKCCGCMHKAGFTTYLICYLCKYRNKNV